MAHRPSIAQITPAKNLLALAADLSDTAVACRTTANGTDTKSDKCHVVNLATTAEASDLIASCEFQAKVKSLPHVLAIKLLINEPLVVRHAEKPRRREFPGKRRLLISFESTVDFGQKILYWRGEGGKELSTLKLLDGVSEEISDYVRDFVIECLEKDDCNFNSNLQSSELHLIDLVDADGCTLLLKAVKEQNVEILPQLLSLPLDVNHRTNDGSSAADIAWRMKRFDILLHLLKANCTFPSNFNEAEATEEIRNFLAISLEMHAAIDEGDAREVKRILDKNPSLRHFYDAQSTSAVARSIMAANIEIYRLLTEHAVLIGPLEKFENFLDTNTCDRMKEQMRELHSNCAQNLPEKHLMTHYANVVLGHDNQHVAQRYKLVKSAFEALDSIAETNLILRIVAARRDFKTHFDFNRTSVQFMEPVCGSPDMTGLFHSYGHIYIAMKELLEEATKAEVVATISHEMDHFTNVLVFGNEGKPYTVDDVESEAKFQEIIDECEKLKDAETIVRYVFENYHPTAHAAELIVRVPQLITLYLENQEKLSEMREIFSDLFAFYYDFVEPKMRESLPVLEKLSNVAIDIKFDDLSDTLKKQIVHAEVKFQGVKVKFSEILGETEEIFQTLTAPQIREILYGENYFTIGRVQDTKLTFYAEREFIDYGIDTSKKIKTNNLLSKLFERKITRNLMLQNFVSAEYNMEYNELTKRYEWNQKVKDNTKSFEDIASEAEELKMILLSDHAGAGKTTTFKQLVGKLKERYADYWVTFVDLKRHLRVYEKFEKQENFDDVMGILLEILDFDRDLDREIFVKLFDCDRVILLYDGVDEISPKFKEFFLNLIKNVKISTQNQQWIATRPQHAETLIQQFSPSVYKLLPYNDDHQREVFVKKVLTSYDIVDEAQQEAALSKIFKSEELYTLNINDPLMLHMVTEIYIEDENLIKNANMFSIYEGMIEMKKKILIKKGEIVNQDRENQHSNLSIWDVHMVYALRLICGDHIEDILADEFAGNEQKSFINLNELSIMRKWRRQRSQWTPEMISRYGFLYIDNWNTDSEFPDFVHRTFAEFFVAKWLIDNIFLLDGEDDEISDRELNLRLRVLICNMCNNFPKFIYVFSFIMTYTVMQQRAGKKHFNQRISDFLTGDLVSEFMLRRCKIYIGRECNEMKNFLYFAWVFCYVQNMSSVWKVEGDRTFLRKCFNECDSFNRIRFLLHAYKGTFCANFFEFTGFPRRVERKPRLVTEEQVLAAFNENFFTNVDFDESFPYREKLSQRIFEVLNLFELFVIPREEQRNFFGNCFANILNLMLKCSFVARNVFEVLRGSYEGHENEVLEKLAVGLVDFYANCRTDKSIKFSLQIDNFWRELEEFLASDAAAVRKILLSDFHKNHPLIHALTFEIDAVVVLYEKFCTKDEIEEILWQNNVDCTPQPKIAFDARNLIKKHIENCDKMDKFYMKKFLLSTNESGDSMLRLLSESTHNEQLSGDQREKHRKIFRVCNNFLAELLPKEQLESLFDLDLEFNLRAVLDERELFILKSLDEIYKKANWNEILQIILLNDYDDMDDTPYFKRSREQLRKVVESQ